jgi:ribosomal-protein-alanine N-acetyltransferase
VEPYSHYIFYILLKNYPDGFIIVDDKGKIIGYIIYSTVRDRGIIISIGVLPNYRQKGIGQMLLDYAINHLRDEVDYVELQVNVSNAVAINFYRKNSFVIVDTILRYYPDGSNAYLMKRMF